MTHRDVLRLAHPAGKVSAGNPSLEVSPQHEALFEWIVRGTVADGMPRIVDGFVAAQAAETPKRATSLVREYRLPREAIKPEHLTSPEVWAALLEDMPMTAPIRSLATMTQVGVIAPGSEGTAKVVAQLGDGERIRKARVHPIQALRDYRHASGIDARLVVVGMVSSGFSIADPADPGMLDVVGFDTATAQLIADFARGTL